MLLYVVVLLYYFFFYFLVFYCFIITLYLPFVANKRVHYVRKKHHDELKIMTNYAVSQKSSHLFTVCNFVKS